MATHDDERWIGERLRRGKTPVGEADALWEQIAGELPVAPAPVEVASGGGWLGGFTGWILAAVVLLVGLAGWMLTYAEHPNGPPRIATYPNPPIKKSDSLPPATSRFSCPPFVPFAAVTPVVVDQRTGSAVALRSAPEPSAPVQYTSSSHGPFPGQYSGSVVPEVPVIPPAPLPLPPASGPAVHTAEVPGFTPVRRRRWELSAGIGPATALGSSSMVIRARAGFAAEVGVHFRLRDRFTLATGLNYTHLRGQFDHTTIYDSLVPHPTFPGTGKTTPATVARRIRHGNRTALLSLPLLVGYRQPLGQRWSAELAAGPELAMLLQASGRGLDVEGRVTAAVPPSSGPAGTLALGYRLQPAIRYRAGRWQFRSTLTLRRTALPTFGGGGAQVRGGVLSTGLGLSYTW